MSHVFIKFNNKYIDGSGIIKKFQDDEIVYDNLKDYGDCYGNDEYGVIDHYYGGNLYNKLQEISNRLEKDYYD